MIKRTQKDVEITTAAYLKSIIESGAKKQDWKDLLRDAFNLHVSFVQAAVGKLVHGNNKDGK